MLLLRRVAASALIVLLLTLASALGATPATAATERCESLAFTPLSGELMYGIEADGLSCSDAHARLGRKDGLTARFGWSCLLVADAVAANEVLCRDRDGATLRTSFGEGCCDLERTPTFQPYRPGLSATPGPAQRSGVDQLCPDFVVGQANSTAYPKHRLPATGGIRGSTCDTLRTFARRMHRGRYEVRRSARAPKWSADFAVRHAGRTWTCRFQSLGASGPSYSVRCRRGGAGGPRIAWTAG